MSIFAVSYQNNIQKKHYIHCYVCGIRNDYHGLQQKQRLSGDIYYNENDMPNEGVFCFCRTLRKNNLYNCSPLILRDCISKKLTK